MRLTRTYVDAPLAVGGSVALSENATAHLVRVMRLGLGEACVVFNGDGHDYDAHPISPGKRGAQVEVMGRRAVTNESPLRVTLAQGGARRNGPQRTATELGVAAIVPLITERTEVKLDVERGRSASLHWRGVIAAACEQSGRAVLPALWRASGPARTGASHAKPGWYLDPDGKDVLHDLPRDSAAITLAIGPKVAVRARPLDARQRRLPRPAPGPGILRTETAGLPRSRPSRQCTETSVCTRTGEQSLRVVLVFWRRRFFPGCNQVLKR